MFAHPSIISVKNTNYTVLWELQHLNPTHHAIMVNELTGVDEGFDPEFETDISDIELIEATYSLPFKVLGTCYSSSRQKALEMAYDCLNEYNRPVFVKLDAEPENMHDKNAIAVYIMSTDDYDKVTYIASEVTKYLHEPLKANALGTTVKEICFRTTFMLVGYYLTIEISKKGIWDDEVIKASYKIN